ncbi:MAG: CBS domain-containing protein [Phycisphaerae bacterium]|nr:CBS domain-containing protein [Phycisphaerae bacterium]
MFEAKTIMKTDLIDIAESFIKNHFRRVPIVAQGKLVGIISRKDIIKYILKLRRQDKSPTESTPSYHP